MLSGGVVAADDIHCTVRQLELIFLRDRSQLSTFMKAYTAYARGGGLGPPYAFPRKSTFIFNH